MKIPKLLTLAGALWLASSVLFAHTALQTATPADGAVMHEAPSTLALTFTEDVQLLKFELVDATGKAVATGFKPSADALKTFSLALPALVPSTYKASWTVLGKDGHRVEGGLGFTVDPAAPETTGAAGGHDDHH